MMMMMTISMRTFVTLFVLALCSTTTATAFYHWFSNSVAVAPNVSLNICNTRVSAW